MAGKLLVERHDREGHRDQVAPRHRLQQVEIALDECVLRDEVRRMRSLLEHLENRSRDLVIALDGLVRVGVDADRDGLDAIRRRRELFRGASAASGFAKSLVSKSMPGERPR
jgi:hypothetical protein